GLYPLSKESFFRSDVDSARLRSPNPARCRASLANGLDLQSNRSRRCHQLRATAPVSSDRPPVSPPRHSPKSLRRTRCSRTAFPNPRPASLGFRGRALRTLPAHAVSRRQCLRSLSSCSLPLGMTPTTQQLKYGGQVARSLSRTCHFRSVRSWHVHTLRRYALGAKPNRDRKAVDR